MFFSDIHTHLLYGTDDGAKTAEDMYSMVDFAYEEGTRLICATPHFHPGYFGDNRIPSAEAFEKLTDYCKNKYPDLQLVLGNELYYKHDCIAWLKSGAVRTYGDTRYVLIEFSEQDSENYISEAADRLFNAGYIPVIAHAERYSKLGLGRIKVLRENGVLIQANAQSLTMRFGFGIKKRLKAMLSEKAVDFIASDAHDMEKRPPSIKCCYEFLAEKYGKEYAEGICCTNAQKLFGRKRGE